MSRIGDTILVENTERKFGENAKYYYIRAQFPDGKEQALLFTEHEMSIAIARAEKNAEDLPKINWLRDIID